MKFPLIFSILATFLLFQGAAFAVTVRDVEYRTKDAGKVVFSHGNHINKKGMKNNCRACHDAIFNLKNRKKYSMADMGKHRSCGACHDGKNAFSRVECARCHQTKEIVYKVKATGPTAFSHKSHLAGSTDCGICHPALFAAGTNKRSSMADMAKGKSCGACHNGKKAFGLKMCVTCHPVRELLFEEKNAGNVVFSHTFHIGLYTCADCHASLYHTVRSKVKVTMQEMEKGKSCGGCHEGKSAFSVKGTCEACHKM